MLSSNVKYVFCNPFKKLSTGTIHLRRRQLSQILDPSPPTVGSFLVLSVGKFGKFLTPPPLRHADVLNGWSHTPILTVCDDKRDS